MSSVPGTVPMRNEDYASASEVDGYTRPAEIVSEVAATLRPLSSSELAIVAARIRSRFDRSRRLSDDKREVLQRGWEAVEAGLAAEKNAGLSRAQSLALMQHHYASAAEYFRQADARLVWDVTPSSYE